MHQLRKLPDAERVKATRELALQIRQLPATAKKESLAEQLANLVTEGDPGHDTLQEVATTLAEALQPTPGRIRTTLLLAQLVRYEHVRCPWTIRSLPPPCKSWKPTTEAASTPTSR